MFPTPCPVPARFDCVHRIRFTSVRFRADGWLFSFCSAIGSRLVRRRLRLPPEPGQRSIGAPQGGGGEVRACQLPHCCAILRRRCRRTSVRPISKDAN